MNNTVLEEVKKIKAFGVHDDFLLLFNEYMSEKKKAYSMLGTIKRNFVHSFRNCFCTLQSCIIYQ